MATLSAAVVTGGLAWVVGQVIAGHMPVGNVSLFVMAAVTMQGAMYQIATAAGNVTQSVTLFGAYADVVSAPPDLPVTHPLRPVPALRHGISVEDVWFRYDQSHPWVLRGVSMFIPAGAHVALVGLNGSGKSTLVKLLCRLYDPERGSIRWDGADIRDLDPAALRQRITGVFQDYMSYELTAAENIGVGDLNALQDGEAVRRASALAGIDAQISRLPHGYDTMLSRVFFSNSAQGAAHAGVALSGGQRQRIALARALLRAGPGPADRGRADVEPGRGGRARGQLDAHPGSAGPHLRADLAPAGVGPRGRPDRGYFRRRGRGAGHARRADDGRRAVREPVHAPGRGVRRSRPRGPGRPGHGEPRTGAMIRSAAVTLAALTTAAALLRWRYAVVTVYGPSMEPDLADGDRLLCRRCGLRQLRRGQLVIFREPDLGERRRPAWLTGAARDKWIVKRVAALPGDPVPNAVREAVGGTDTVPPRAVVVLGDGPRSSDSRQWGFIPARNVLGAGCRRLA